MSCEIFIPKKFRPKTLAIIEQANAIAAEYQAMEFTLNLRQLFYQFVARELIPNKQNEYKRLGAITSDARLAGLLDWAAIEDRTRIVHTSPSWDNPNDVLVDVAEQYQESPWLSQRWAPEVWIEKEALVGVIEPICRRMRVPYFACRGYASQSGVYGAGKRFARLRQAGREPIVLHLGDHDPSGIDMSRDNSKRLALFARHQVTVNRLALNMDQVRTFAPPPNPAKETDARFDTYRAEFGDSCWELDALDPPVIEELIQSALDELIDPAAWRASMAREERSRTLLQAVATNWDAVADFLAGMA